MRYEFVICDVFTTQRFGGNQLAVIPDASGLSTARMQQVAREFGFSETTFVLPADESSHARRVRIFTPAVELPFAGHPNIGTAFVLATTGRLGPLEAEATVVFEELAGLVRVSIRSEAAALWCELEAPAPLTLGPTVTVAECAAALSLSELEIAAASQPVVASVGAPILMVELEDSESVRRATPVIDVLRKIDQHAPSTGIYLYALKPDSTVHARLFAPLNGIPEDPATGAAACTVAGLLASRDPRPDGTFHWRIAQGAEMGRPSTLDARAEKRGGELIATAVGGHSVFVAEGAIEVD